MKAKPDAESVAHYLKDNPTFFEQFQDLLADLTMPHPHGGRTISLSERQVLTLRDKVRALESRLSELIRFGEENDAIGERVHRLSLGLIKSPDWPHAARLVTRHLVEDFTVPHVALRLWGYTGEGAEFEDVPAGVKNEITALSHPYCGAATGHAAAEWFGPDAGKIRSLCQIPLRRGADVIGALGLGSEDEQRFYGGMGTLFLSQIGNMVAAVANRTLSR